MKVSIRRHGKHTIYIVVVLKQYSVVMVNGVEEEERQVTVLQILDQMMVLM